MFYCIGCHIPRGADCDEGFKCCKGIYCRCLEVCSVDDSMRPRASFLFNDKNCIFFESEDEASRYLNSLKQ